MSLKIYGIFLAYAPTIDLRNEGLGRYLAAFLKGAAHRKDVRFTLVCPSWTKASLESLFDAEQVPVDCVDIIAPNNQPPLLKLYEKVISYKKRVRTVRWNKFALRFVEIKEKFLGFAIDKIAGSSSFFELALALLPFVVVFLIFFPLWLLLLLGISLTAYVWKILCRLGRPFRYIRQRLRRIFTTQPKNDHFVLRMYRAMRLREERRMLELVDELSHVGAWYCPTPFWPVFNKIDKPKLLCVPDIVLTDFSVGFATLGGDRILDIFSEIEHTVREAEYFVTYSENVKWETLVDRYSVVPENISVVHHAPSDLSRFVYVKGLADEHETSLNYCRGQFVNSIYRSANIDYVKGIDNADLRFVFYASQFRPNKNILTLLRAYKYLLDNHIVNHKLILSGNPASVPDVQKFISDYRLEDDILFLHGLKTQELAACYKLADLAVNPSLSEGGCPFTFTEALSVGTPVVMARIPVTEEVLTDPELQEVTLFDPYDWQSLAERIEWALAHRDDLLAIQRRTYAELSRRTWADVVDEHLVVLERIAQLPAQPANSVA